MFTFILPLPRNESQEENSQKGKFLGKNRRRPSSIAKFVGLPTRQCNEPSRSLQHSPPMEGRYFVQQNTGVVSRWLTLPYGVTTPPFCYANVPLHRREMCKNRSFGTAHCDVGLKLADGLVLRCYCGGGYLHRILDCCRMRPCARGIVPNRHVNFSWGNIND